MIAYHVTNNVYLTGETVSIPEGQESRYHKSGTDDQRRTNEFFDNFIDCYYPELVHRKNALFAFEDLEDAKQFCRSTKSKFIYKVDFNVSYRGPFVLVNTLMKNLGNLEKCDAIAKEYFSPDKLIDNQDWLTYELIGPSFKVIQELKDRARFGFPFISDYDKSIRLFGDPSKGTSGRLG